jgi:hypothetical protein
VSPTFRSITAVEIPTGSVIGERIVFEVHFNDDSDSVTLELSGRGAYPIIPGGEKIVVIEEDHTRPKLLRGWPADPSASAEEEYAIRISRRKKGVESKRSNKRDMWDMTNEEIIAYKNRGLR